MTKTSTTPPSADHIVDGNRLRLLPGGMERQESLFALIHGATKSLRILFYMFNAGPVATRVRDALVDAAKRGVRVELLLDEFGSSKLNPEFLAPLKEAGAHTCIFHPAYGRRYLIRNHQKLVVADGRIGLIGGANIDRHYLEDTGKDRWRDLWLEMEGPALTELAEYFDDILAWTSRRKPKIRDLRRIITRHSRADGPLAWRFSGPMRRHNPWPRAIVSDILAAKHVDMIAAYFSPSYAMIRRLGGVVARGGDVRIVSAAKSDNNATIAASRHTYTRMLRRGISVFEYEPAKLHTKLYVIDDVTYIGSANFDFRSLYLNLEMMLRIDDAEFAAAMRAFIDAEVADSTPITPALHARRASWWRRIKWAVSYFLVTTMDYTVTRRINFGLE
jgi:cardiolipin synthase